MNDPMDDLLYAPLTDLAARLERGELSSRELTEGYLARIAALDRDGPALASVLSVNPQAAEAAALRDQERRSGRVRGPLHGLPILLKDNIETLELPTTAGSLALEGSQLNRDAAVTERLRAAGAVILGKTNLSEWANFRSRRSSSGWSSLGGQTRNPYALNRNPCGSSSGSGAAVAAALGAAAIGTETDGSIVCPASLCGTVGAKPTVGRISRRGIIPIAASQDTAGPMTRTVADAALLLGVMAGPDPADAVTQSAPAWEAPALQEGDLRGVRLGVARGLFGKHEGADRVAEAALETLRALGADVVDTEVREPDDLRRHEYEVLLYEFKDGLNRYLASLSGEVGDLGALIAYNEENRERVMPYFGQEHFLAAAEKDGLDAPAYREARAACLRLARGALEDALREHRLDALLAPTAGPAWVTDVIAGDRYGGSSSSLPAVAGYPHVTVPAGLHHGLPIGLSIFGGAWSEARLLNVAYRFEAARGPFPRPGFAAQLP